MDKTPDCLHTSMSNDLTTIDLGNTRSPIMTPQVDHLAPHLLRDDPKVATIEYYESFKCLSFSPFVRLEKFSARPYTAYS